VIVGILGAIGSGKSATAAAFEALGATRIDADRLAHDALRDPGIAKRVVERFGSAVLDEEGGISRPAVARRVFAPDGTKDLEALEAIVHPHVRERIEGAVAEARRTGRGILVIDAPLLAETELLGLCDVLVFVDASRKHRTERVRASRSWDEEELLRREVRQMPEAEKRALADFVIENDGELDHLRDAVKVVVSKLGGHPVHREA
jgi:dephospho-CoA kinase